MKTKEKRFFKDVVTKKGKVYLNMKEHYEEVQKAKKEVFDDLDKYCNFECSTDGANFTIYLKELKKRHLSTFAKEQKQHNYRKKKGSQLYSKSR